MDALDAVAGADRFQMKDQIIESKHLVNFSSQYPVIQRIYYGKPTNNVDSLLKKIGQATHIHKDNALGSIKPRLASPIHVRIQKVGNEYVPIVTQLYTPSNFRQKQKRFINAIIK